MSYQEAKTNFEALFKGTMPEEDARDYLIALYERGESVQELQAAVEVMRSHMVPFETPATIQKQLIDNCGTGGDKSGSFNISTTVSILLASLGCYVAKHGNRSITSRSGSADMLEALGITLDLDQDKQRTMLEETGFVFLFAQMYHPAMKHIMPIRKSISHRTIFNFLGPLCNPAGVTRQFIGVYDPDFVSPLIQVLKATGSTRAMVACGKDGLDEISISAKTAVCDLDGKGDIHCYDLSPDQLGIQRAEKDAISGGTAEENAFITRQILTGHVEGPKRDIVRINAAASLVVAGKAPDMATGIAMADDAIDSGKARIKLEQIIQVSQRLA